MVLNTVRPVTASSPLRPHGSPISSPKTSRFGICLRTTAHSVPVSLECLAPLYPEDSQFILQHPNYESPGKAAASSFLFPQTRGISCSVVLSRHLVLVHSYNISVIPSKRFGVLAGRHFHHCHFIISSSEFHASFHVIIHHCHFHHCQDKA